MIHFIMKRWEGEGGQFQWPQSKIRETVKDKSMFASIFCYDFKLLVAIRRDCPCCLKKNNSSMQGNDFKRKFIG